MQLNAMLTEQVKPVIGLDPVTPSTSTPDYVSLKYFERICIVILVKNATTVTGSAITVKQASAVAGTGEKAVSFTKAYRNVDTGAAGGDVLSEFAVSSDTFTTQAVNSKNAMYVIEIKAEDLDVNNGFDCIRAGTGDGTATTITVLYLLYGAKVPTTSSAITD